MAGEEKTGLKSSALKTALIFVMFKPIREFPT
jgi:hypothetical protein